MHDGDEVMFAGLETRDVLPGVHGHVLSATAQYAHVQWEGPMGSIVGLHDIDDLVPVSRNKSVTASLDDSLDDSLDVGSLNVVASARDAYDLSGEEGLLASLAHGGRLERYASLAQEALTGVMEGLRQDAMLRHVIAGLDEDEADQVYRTVALGLLSQGDF